MKSDVEIARAAKMRPIAEIAGTLGIAAEQIEPYGRYKAKLTAEALAGRTKKNGKLILVTAINPTPAGEGKTTTSIGLADALHRQGKKTVVALREPSLGPCFGMKGGAAGGGYAQVVPMEDINLHFTGDFHAITTAHNLLAALIDNHIFQGNALDLDVNRIVWKRVLDINDRALRHVVTGLGGRVHGVPREFGADLGAEKFFDIKCRLAGLKPDTAVIVATVRALKMNGGVPKDELGTENLDALKRGAANLEKHIENIGKFGLPAVVAVNVFPTDTEAELSLLEELCARLGAPAVRSEVWAKGGAGGLALADAVEAAIKKPSDFHPLYDVKKPIAEKIEMIAREIYGADGVDFTPEAKKQMTEMEMLGMTETPVCMAKTQYSFSDNPALLGRPAGFRITVRELRASCGAGFIVALTGSVLTMPGLPKVPAAMGMDITGDGVITGLF